MANTKELAVFRSIDKADKIGVDGVIALLQKPYADFGAELDPVRAGLIGQFLGGKDVESMVSWFKHAPLVMRRLRLIEAAPYEAIDALMSLTPNEDQTWRNGGRPDNVAWAIDDICDFISKMEAPQ